jgi:hypothetical protein
MRDGWLSDRTLDVSASVILLNTNAGLICFAEVTPSTPIPWRQVLE